MLKRLSVVIMLLACCYCADNETELVDEPRAKKKKSPARLWALLLLLAFSKVAIIKVISFFMFLGFFQKLFSIAGVFLKYFLNRPPKAPPQNAYGPPQEYNTVGYSYGPPEHETFDNENLPSITELGGSLNWLFNKNV